MQEQMIEGFNTLSVDEERESESPVVEAVLVSSLSALPEPLPEPEPLPDPS